MAIQPNFLLRAKPNKILTGRDVSLIGKTVKVIIDRPKGSCHPKYKDLVYDLNYGYIEGILAGDGEEQDAYVMGVQCPLKSFEGEVIAVIHRVNDVEDKFVVAPRGVRFSEEEIVKATHFQEKFFVTEVIT